MALDLLLELGAEELPASFVEPALADLEQSLSASFAEARLVAGLTRRFGTPRRLAIWVRDIEEKQPDFIREVMGPAVKAAFEADGTTPKAPALKFAESQATPVEKLERKSTPKGEYLCVRIPETGKPTRELLPAILEKAIRDIRFRKSMRSGHLEVTFARPLHWIVSLYGTEVIPVAFGDVKSDRITHGHRFLDPEPIRLERPADYVATLERAHVWAEIDRRRHYVEQAASGAAQEAGGTLLADAGLLDTVTQLVEWPGAVLGSFDARHLDLPPEVLVSEMKGHQKYFSVVGADGRLLPNFVAISNTPVKDVKVSRAGYERVLRARLADARFFFDEDQKRPLASRVDDLKKVVFQQQLGSTHEKVERFRQLALDLAHWSGRGDAKVIERAATLSKADLVTGMVGEFPELQGIMGREYAAKQGEGADVALAIDEHYLPRNAGDRLPTQDAGALIGIADRLDSICGLVGIGKKPSGATDPFGIRRQALAVLSIVLDRKYRFDLGRAVERAIELLGSRCADPKKTRADVLEYFRDRLEVSWAEGNRPDVVRAVLSAGFHDLVGAKERLEALSALVGRPDFEPLAAAFKRVVNIVQKQAQAIGPGEVDDALFSDEAERGLYKAFLQARSRVDDAIGKSDARTAVLAAADLKPAVDSFFDKVLVMAEDTRVRDNRVRLLRSVGGLFGRLADFGQIQAGGEAR